VRLFTAVFPDAGVTAAVDAVVAAAVDPTTWRVVAPERRHVTLCFHGDADPDALASALRERATGLPAPHLRCTGAGIFGDALWLGVTADPPDPVTALVVAAGGDAAGHVGHLTVARRRRGAPRRSPVPAALAAHVGPVWTPTEVALVASGDPYVLVERVALTTGAVGVGDP